MREINSENNWFLTLGLKKWDWGEVFWSLKVKFGNFIFNIILTFAGCVKDLKCLVFVLYCLILDSHLNVIYNNIVCVFVPATCSHSTHVRHDLKVANI